ncbi:MAG: hypothetical protein ACPGJS_05045 [Flammeovirgaceae bacterium]
MNLEILKYIAFGYSFIVGLIAFSLSEDLMNSTFFKRCLIAGMIAFLTGIVFEFTNSFKLDKGLTMLIMSISMIYLGCFQILRTVFKKWTGTDPYITSEVSIIGERPTASFWMKYPKNRKIMWTDFLFSITQALLPIFIITALALWII